MGICRKCRTFFEDKNLILITILTSSCLFISLFALFNNYPSYFVHFLIFPVATVSYLYPKKGIYFTGTLGMIYLIFNSFKAGEPNFTPVTATAYIFFIIVLSIIISILSITIKESEKKYLQIINDQSELIARVLPDGNIKIVNDAFCNYYGLKRSNIAGKKFLQVMLPENIVKIQKAMKSLTINKPVTNLDISIVKGEGEVRWQNLNIRAIYDEYGKLTENQFVARDITENKLFEKELQDKVNYVSALMDSIPAPVFYRDVNGVYYDCNQAFEELVGQKKNEIIGKNISDFFPDELASFYSKKDSEIIKKPHHQQYEYRITDKTGAYHDVLFSKTARLDSEGGVTGIVGMALDITARKEVEKELLKSLEEKTTLLQEVHHRVKNNLAIINSMLSMQMNDLENECFQEPLKDAKSRIISMALVHEELYKSDNIAFIDAGSHFRLLLKELVTNFGNQMNIEVEVDANGCSLSIDRAIPCSLVVNELVTNSLKYAFNEVNSGKISVFMKEHDNYHTISVSDTGTGMPEDFDFENSKTLGIRLVKNIIEYQMEGRIELNTEKGTTWNIEIPLTN